MLAALEFCFAIIGFVLCAYAVLWLLQAGYERFKKWLRYDSKFRRPRRNKCYCKDCCFYDSFTESCTFHCDTMHGYDNCNYGRRKKEK